MTYRRTVVIQGIVCNELNHSRIAASAAGTHQQAFKGRQAHGSILAFAVHHSAQAGTVAQVADNNLLSDGADAQEFAYAAADITVAGTVEAVAAYMQFFFVHFRHTVHIGLRGHGLVEGSVKHRNLGCPFHNLLTGFNTHQVGRVMQGPERETVTDSLLRFFIHDNGSRKRAAAVQYPVTHRTDLISAFDHAEFRILENFEHQLRSCLMVRDFLDDLGLFVSGAVLQFASFNADPLHQSFGQLFFAVHINQLVFQRG